MTSLNMAISITSGVAATEVPDAIAETCQEAYDALKVLPVNRQIDIDFGPEEYAGPDKIDDKPVTDDQKAAWNARRFARQAKAWAVAQEVTLDVLDSDGNKTGERVTPLVFSRKGDVKGNPKRVSFRIYAPRPAKDDATEEAVAE